MKKVFIITIFFVVLVSEKMVGQNKQYIELAEAAIEYFKCSINSGNYKFYGLTSVDAINIVRIGEAIPHDLVKLTDLQGYNQEKDPREIVKEMGYVTVPLINQENESVETFGLLNKRNGKFISTGLGQAPYALNFYNLKRNKEIGKESKLIRIAGLNLAYAGIEIDGILNLISIIDQKEKRPQPASQVFEELAKLLSKMDDVPR